MKGVILMLFLTVFMLMMVVVGILAMWPVCESAKASDGEANGDAGSDDAAQQPTTLEGALTAQLLRGEINRRQYRHELERLAARDDEAHPLTAPN
ncbi:hypothetical protein [Actinoplanes teichomyceticus]|uniref:hypothetical protein n=1 Tax=Actinoplanes teichomyceticus TaxID=1867 RepID=UPI000F09CE29|nr:hypothetical protein [Actinoplanes teichomyceticus]